MAANRWTLHWADQKISEMCRVGRQPEGWHNAVHYPPPVSVEVLNVSYSGGGASLAN